MIPDSKLDFWFQNNRNVLLVGKHGLGKTAIVKSCFERNGLIHRQSYLYFSASTLDPWVDLVGVPKEKIDENGNSYLDLIRPAALVGGKIEAIFFDEFNRSPKKVRNAVMELLQFKSINGLPFPNLKCVWAAINPDDNDIYDVEKIDPAQKDRFHVIKELEYKPDRSYFINRFGTDCGTAAVEWWNDLPVAEKDIVTPRRLEYALEEYNLGGNLTDILPVSSGINKLLQGLRNGPIEAKIKSLFDSKDVISSKKFLANDNNFNGSLKIILASEEYLEFFLPCVPKERLVSLMSENSSVCRHVCHQSTTNKEFWNIMRDIVSAGQDEKLVKLLRRFVSGIDDSFLTDCIVADPAPAYFNKSPQSGSLAEFEGSTYKTLSEKESAFNLLASRTGKNISCDDAKNILLSISNITEDLWATNLLTPAFKNLIGIINHCLSTIKKETNENNILQTLTHENKKLYNLFVKIYQINLMPKVLHV